MSKSKRETAQVDLIINGQSANNNLRDLEAAARKVKSELRGLMPGTEEFNKARANFERINKQLTDTRVKAGMAQSAWAKMKQEIKTTFIGNLGANLATLGFEKLTGYITGAFDSAVKLSDQFADIAKTTGMSVEEVKALNTELGKINTRTSMSDLREIAKVGGQFGVAKDQLLDFVRAVDRTTIALGDEFSGGAEEVASVMSKLRNVLQDIKSDNIGTDIAFISNAINELAASGVATGPVVADFANRIGGFGSQAGLSTGQILGLSATLQELGVTTERGGTAVVKIIQKMLTNSQTFAEIAGIEFKQFEQMLNTDLFGAFAKVMEGSKNLGQSSTALAGIIKELDVDGAGASEVFAKLGSNTALLAQKVDLASNSLSNLDSITNEANLKNNNLAGSVEQLSKSWNKLIASAGVQSFFAGLINFLTQAIDGMRDFGDMVVYNYNIVTKGKAEADKLYALERAKIEAEAQKESNRLMAESVQGFKNKYTQMNVEQIKSEEAKLKILQKTNIDYMRSLRESGQMERYAIEAENAKKVKAELDALQVVLKAKIESNNKSLNDKRALSLQELKAAENAKKESEKLAKKQANEQEKLVKKQWKAQEKMLDEAIKNAESAYKKDLENFKKQLEEKWKALNDFWNKEQLAAEDLNVLQAKDADEKLAAEISRITTRYQLEIEKTKEGSYQRKLLEAQLANEVEMLNKASTQRKVDELANYANAFASVLNNLVQHMNIIENQQLVQSRQANEQQKQILDKRLKDGLISQDEYAAEMLQLNREMENQERELANAQAQRQHNAAIFEATLRTILAWVEAFIDPVKIPGAIAASAQAAILAATPVPQFFDGGYTGPQKGMGIDGKGGFPAILHPNEYVVNAENMQNPYVFNMTKQLEGQNAGGISAGGNYIEMQKLNTTLDRLNQKLDSGIYGVWDWDYDQNTRERLQENYKRRVVTAN